jgi:lipid-binding SYLF domain-containing protein
MFSILTRSVFRAITLSTAVIVCGCSTTDTGTGDSSAERHAINSDVDASLSKLYVQIPGSRELVGKAVGVLVFPSVISAGLGVSGSYGKGELRRGSQVTGYYSTTAGGLGLIAGADSKAEFVLFMNQQSYDRFVASKGWTAGADASVTLVSVGADGRVDTGTSQPEVIGLVLSNGGLMANLSIDGSKVNHLDL